MKKAATTFMAVLLVMTLVTLARAVEQVQRSELVTTRATVEAVDQQSRMVTLKGSDGNSFSIKAGDEVRNLSQVSPGDQVTVRYYRSMAVQLAKPGQKPMSSSSRSVERAAPGETPGGTATEQVTTTATVMNIDKKNSEVTLKGPEGNVMTVRAADPSNLAQAEDRRPAQHHIHAGHGYLPGKGKRVIPA